MILLSVAAAALALWLLKTRRISRTMLLLLLTLAGISALVLLQEGRAGQGEAVREIARDAGAADLSVKTADGAVHEVTIRVPDVAKAELNTTALLRAAADELPKKILGKNESAEQIEWDLTLPSSLQGGAVEVFWSSSRPEILHWDGRVDANVPASGEEVELLATLSAGEESLEFRQMLTVYPSREEAALQQRLQEAADAHNSADGETYALPDTLDGAPLLWTQRRETRGVILAGLALLVGVLLALSAREKQEKEEALRRRALTQDYPALVGRMQLLYEAGLGTRQVFARLAEDHRRILRETGKSRPAYEEAARTWYEMGNGVNLATALTGFGERAGLAPYRSLALLLARTEKRGGGLLLPLLEKEVQEAREARYRRARTEGEKAAVRLLLPMGLMLLAVLLVLMAPAMLSF